MIGEKLTSEVNLISTCERIRFGGDSAANILIS